MRLSGAQSPFARSGRYPSRRDFQNLVGRHYPAFLAPTDSCANPKPSSCLGKPSCTRSLQVAVSPCWESDLPGVVSANLSSRAWTPTPAALVVHLPVSSHKTTAFPTLGPGRRDRSRDHSRSGEGHMQSASHTPSSHLWERCVASTERSDGVAERHGCRAAGALICLGYERGTRSPVSHPQRRDTPAFSSSRLAATSREREKLPETANFDRLVPFSQGPWLDLHQLAG